MLHPRRDYDLRIKEKKMAYLLQEGSSAIFRSDCSETKPYALND
jgi:hypothetical protein